MPIKWQYPYPVSQKWAFFERVSLFDFSGFFQNIDRNVQPSLKGICWMSARF